MPERAKAAGTPEPIPSGREDAAESVVRPSNDVLLRKLAALLPEEAAVTDLGDVPEPERMALPRNAQRYVAAEPASRQGTESSRAAGGNSRPGSAFGAAPLFVATLRVRCSRRRRLLPSSAHLQRVCRRAPGSLEDRRRPPSAGC